MTVEYAALQIVDPDAIGSNPWLISQTEGQAWSFSSATHDANGVCLTANIVWSDLSTGVYTADTVNSTWHAVDAYHATYVPTSGPTKTVRQNAITRDANGNPTAAPTLVVS